MFDDVDKTSSNMVIDDGHISTRIAVEKTTIKLTVLHAIKNRIMQ
jgi:hypothetical protein